MKDLLEKSIAFVSVAAAVAYSLGWLKTFSYFATFGVSLSSLDLPLQYYLFESWFVLENVLFFVLFSWALLAGFRLLLPPALPPTAPPPTALLIPILKSLWVFFLTMVGVLYLMLPYRTDAAFAHPKHAPDCFLISSYFTLLKFMPFFLYAVVLIIVLAILLREFNFLNDLKLTLGAAAIVLFIGGFCMWVHYRQWPWETEAAIYSGIWFVLVVGAAILMHQNNWHRQKLCTTLLEKLRSLFPLPELPLRSHHLIYIVVLLAWSVSLAKHIGAIDGKLRLNNPSDFFARATLYPSSQCPSDLKKALSDGDAELYVLHQSPEYFVVLNHKDYTEGNRRFKVLFVPRSSAGWIEDSHTVQTETPKLLSICAVPSASK